jgi:phage gp36-like protein
MAYYLSAEKLRSSMGERPFLQCLDDDGDETADEAILADVIERAESLGEGYASRLYSLVTLRANPPALLVTLLTTLAKQYAYERRTEFCDPERGTPVQASYNEAIRVFGEIGKGTIRLDQNGTPEAPVHTRGHIRTGTYCGRPVGPGFIKDGTGAGGY